MRDISLSRRDFIDRDELREIFKNHCENFLKNDYKIISYYGIAGIGKTALLKNLCEPQNFSNNYVCLYHNFDNLFSMKEVLKKLVRKLSKVGFKFPTFEMGCFLYEKNIGESAYPPEQKNFLTEYPILSGVIGVAASAFATAGTGGIAGSVLATDVIFKAVPVVTDLFDKVIEFIGKTGSNDLEKIYRQNVERTVGRLKEISEETQNENELEDKLVELFAQDFNYCTKKLNKKVILMLDGYDVLLLKGQRTKEHPERDWWLKGDENAKGLLESLQNVIFVLSGRDKLNFEGELGEKIIYHELKPFDTHTSLEFLQNRGIVNNQILCYQIAKLTQGYPLYLELCADQYNLLKKKDKYHEPEISDFGPENEDFINRRNKIVFNLIECMDDTGIRETIKYFCALKIWFDEMAWNIIPVFNETAYNILKNYSFVRNAEYDDELNISAFYVDNAVQEILLDKYKKENPFVIRRSVLNTNEFFKSYVRKSSINYEQCRYSYRLWADIIYRLVDDVDELQKIYEEYFEERTGLRSEYSVDYDFRQEAENVTQTFFHKVKKLLKSDSENSFVYAYFELALGYLKNFQKKYIAASEYLESAYKKFIDLDSDGEYKILTLKILSETYNGQGLNKKQVEVHRKIVEYVQKYYSHDEEKQLESLDKLYEILSENNLREDALEVREDIIDVCKNFHDYDDEETLEKMGELADEWDDFGKYDKALEIRKKMFHIVKEQNDIPALIEATKQIAYIYHHAKDYENEVKYYNQVLELCEEEYGEDSHESIEPLYELSETFFDIDNLSECQKLREKIVEIYKNEIEEKISLFGETSEEVHDKIQEFVNILNKMDFDEEALSWLNKKADYQRTLIEKLSQTKGKTHEKTIEAIEHLEWTLNSLKEYDEQVKLYKNLINDLEKEEAEDDNEKLIDALESYVILLGNEEHELNCFENSAERFEVLDSTYEKLINLIKIKDDKEELLRQMSRWADACQIWKHYEKALEIRRKIVEKMENAGYNLLTANSRRFLDYLYALNDLAKSFSLFHKFDEELQIRHKIVDSLKEWLTKHLNSRMFEEFITASTGLAEMYQIRRNSHRRYRKKGQQNSVTSIAEENKELTVRTKFLENLKELFDIHSEMEIANKIIYAATDLINCYCTLKDFDNALKVNAEILKFAQKNFGDYAEETLESMYARGDIYFESGNIAEFEKSYKDVIEILKEKRGEENFEHIVALKNLAAKYSALERYDDAIELGLQIVDIYKRFHSEKILHFIETHSALSDFYEMKGDVENSLKYRDKVIDLYNKTWGKYDINSIDAISRKADTLEKFEKYSEALKLRKEVVKIYNFKKKKSNDDDFDEYLIDAFEKLIALLEKMKSPEIEKWQLKLDSLENDDYDTGDSDLIFEGSEEEADSENDF